jgi:hypothetical protein
VLCPFNYAYQKNKTTNKKLLLYTSFRNIWIYLFIHKYKLCDTCCMYSWPADDHLIQILLLIINKSLLKPFLCYHFYFMNSGARDQLSCISEVCGAKNVKSADSKIWHATMLHCRPWRLSHGAASFNFSLEPETQHNAIISRY